MLKRLGQWGEAVFLKRDRLWSWIGVLIGIRELVLRAWPMSSSYLLKSPADGLLLLIAGAVLIWAVFLAWKEERDKIEDLTRAAHLVLQGLPKVKSDVVQMEFVFNFRNEGAIPLEKVFVDVLMLTFGSQFITRNERRIIDYLAAGQPYAVRLRIPREQIVRSAQADTSIKFRLLFEYERTEKHLRFKGEDEVQFDLDTQTFQVISRLKPRALPPPPSRWRRAWSQLTQMGG